MSYCLPPVGSIIFTYTSTEVWDESWHILEILTPPRYAIVVEHSYPPNSRGLDLPYYVKVLTSLGTVGFVYSDHVVML